MRLSCVWEIDSFLSFFLSFFLGEKDSKAYTNVSLLRSFSSHCHRHLSRPNDLGGPFDIFCMFPVTNLSDIPDPALDSNWNWTQSDICEFSRV